MDALSLGLAVVIFVVGLLISLPVWWKAASSVKGELRLIAFAWAAVFIGQGQMFEQKEAATGLGSLGAGAFYQLGWMGVGAALLALALMKVNLKINRGTATILGLLIYGFVGIAGAAFSPSPSLSIYKAAQIIMDVTLLTVVLSALARNHRPRAMLELSYFLLTLVIASAALGGIFWPDKAYTNIEGAFTSVLRGVYPQVHFNELGLLCAIMLIASLRRSFEKGTGRMRIYWISVSVLAATVLFHAQARTSLASATLSILILAFFIPRMRKLALVGVLVVCGILVSQWLSGGINLNIEGTTAETYLRRGASDEQIESLSGRLGLWQAGWEMFKDRPIFGHGMDAGVRYGGVAYGLSSGTNMHSAHMQILANNGILGYIAWLVFIITAVLALWRGFRNEPEGVRGEEGRLRLEMLLVAFVILFRSALGHVLVTHHFSFLIFIALFICAVAPRYVSPATSTMTEDRSDKEKSNLLARRKRSTILVTNKK